MTHDVQQLVHLTEQAAVAASTTAQPVHGGYLVDGLADTLNEQVLSLCTGGQQVSQRQQQLQVWVLIQFLHGQASHVVCVHTQYEGYTDLN